MKESIAWQQIRLNTLIALIQLASLSAWIALMPPPSNATEPQRPVATSPATSAAAPQKDPGMKIFVDPKTGKISKPSPPAELPEASQKSLQEAQEPLPQLFEVPSPRPGGGGMIDLKGQFRNPLKVTRDADGKLSIKHQSGSSSSQEKK
jgi:hypothetical protein